MSYESIILNTIRESRRRQRRARYDEENENGMMTEVLAMSDQVFAAYSEFANGSLMIAINLGENVFKSAQIPNVTRDNAEVIFNNIYTLINNGNLDAAVDMMIDFQHEYTPAIEASTDEGFINEEDDPNINQDLYSDLGFETFESSKFKPTIHGGPWHKIFDIDDVLSVEFVIADHMNLFATIIDDDSVAGQYTTEYVPAEHEFMLLEDELESCRSVDEIHEVLKDYDFRRTRG